MVGVDVVRGGFLIAFLASVGWFTAPAWFEHAPWAGIHPIDLVFPAFVTLTGVGLALAHRSGVRTRTTLAQVGRRCLVLLVVGLAYNAHAQLMTTGRYDAYTLRWTGVLQLFALVTAAVTALHLVLRGPWAWAVCCAALAAAYTAYLIGFAADCPGAALTPACNPSGTLDPAVFGAAHVYRQGAAGHDPEGLPSILGALVSAAAGATGGHVLRAFGDRSGWRGRVRRGAVLLATAAGCLMLAWVTEPLVVTTKRLWTPPFAATVAAGVLVVIAIAHLLLDRNPPGDRAPTGTAVARWPARELRWTLTALGRNSLLVYFGAQGLMTTLVSRPLGADASWAERLAERVAIGGNPALGFVLALVTAFTALTAVLHWRHIYLRP